ncbi:protein spire homolog 1-like isoform X1 [Mauremys reevesii]|uniref:protein spire homolog 1-like isoform X1 n=2 Tax=Mauremys reevesii TaxID=260615 RepID=UPI00193F5A56|nr:protein spire homolog 1-like isoform X1 [Mauremys reevesii]
MGNGESKTLDYSSCEWSNVTKVSLGELLRCCDQPISEEQAWALCFQCCHKMKQLAQGPHPVVIKGLGSILIHSDGAVSFMVHPKSDVNKTQHLEEQLTERLGMVIYKALDWGIDNHLERELSEPLEKLISLLLKLDTEATKPAITFQDVLKICEEHLPRPSEAASYYRTVCRVLFAEYEDLQKLMLTLQSSKESLRRMEVENLLENDTQREKDNYWQASLWHDVIRELQNGVRLRKAMEQPQRTVPPKEYARSPYELLAEDIRRKRYTLRKVKINSEQNCKSSEGNTVASQLPLKPVSDLFSCDGMNRRIPELAEAIVTYPILKSGKASERKLKENSPKAPSLHDLLMMEIKQPQKLRPSSTEKNGSSHKDTFVMPMFSLNSPCGNGLSLQNASTGLTIHKVQKQLLIPDLLVPEFQEADGALKYNLGVISHRSVLTSSSTDCSADCTFTPKSMPVRGHCKTSSFLNLNQRQPFCRGRSKSLRSALQIKEDDYPSPTRWPSPTIAELIGTRYAVMSEMEGSRQRDGCAISSQARVCFHCHKQMVFLWPYRCHLCSSVICCDCCIKMSMPYRPCVHLPLNLIKALRLSKEEDSATQDQKSSQLLFEVEHWDCSRVPLVFEPYCLAQPLASQRETMMDWPSMDICTTCEQYLLHVLSSQQQCIPPRKRSRSWTELE